MSSTGSVERLCPHVFPYVGASIEPATNHGWREESRLPEQKTRDWRQFEEEVGLLVREFGYRAEVTKPSGDGGIDVIGYGRRGKVVIQCKLYGRGKVGGPLIDQLGGALRRERAAHAICITTSGFTKQAIQFAAAAGILLLGRKEIVELCRRKHLTLPSMTALEHPSGATVHLTADRLTIGRDRGCQIIVTDPTVSRIHSLLVRQGLHLSLSDGGSTNGTKVNGQLLMGAYHLNYGDCIEVGTSKLRVVMCQPAAGPLERLPPHSRK
jgi:hypothetical protein